MVWSVKLGVALLLIAIYVDQFHTSGSIISQRCESILVYGRWHKHGSSRQWQPFGTMTAVWNAQSIATCLANQTIIFAGDSTAREILWATARKVNFTAAREMMSSIDRHQGFSFHEQGTSLQFVWDPMVDLNYSTQLQMLKSIVGQKASHPIIWSTGLWQTRYHGGQFLNTTSAALSNIEAISRNMSTKAILIPPPTLNHNLLNQERGASLTPQRMLDLNSLLWNTDTGAMVRVAWALQAMSSAFDKTTTQDGMHVAPGIAEQQSNLLLGYICNHIFSHTNKASSYACTANNDRNTWTTSITISGLALMVYSASRIDSFTTSDHYATMCAILAYCFLADRTSTFVKSNKLISHHAFMLSTISLVSICWMSRFQVFACQWRIHQRWKDRIGMKSSLPKGSSASKPAGSIPLQLSRPVETLSRDHTDEIKGWMQIIILFYHYYGMSSNLWIYQVVRLLVAGYLFLLGYGHATYFRKSCDFGLRRVMSVLLRINLLSVSLTQVMNTTYDFYYFPCISTFWFLVVYTTCRLQPRGTLTGRLATTLAAAVLTHIALNRVDTLEWLLQMLKTAHGPDINHKELTFRLKLDHIVPFCGIALADLRAHFAAYPRYLPPLRRLWKNKSTHIMAAFILVGLYISISIGAADKFQYNVHHPYISVMPIIAYFIWSSVTKLPLPPSLVLIEVGRN